MHRLFRDKKEVFFDVSDYLHLAVFMVDRVNVGHLNRCRREILNAINIGKLAFESVPWFDLNSFILCEPFLELCIDKVASDFVSQNALMQSIAIVNGCCCCKVCT